VNTENILLKQKQAKILLTLRDTNQNWYISSIAKASGTTYVHACNFLVACEGLGITTSEKHGKLKIIKLTEKGMRVADIVLTLSNLVNIQEQQRLQQEPQK
jgi:predicted transcriptional regulator